MMWLLLGLTAMAFTLVNWIQYKAGKDYRLAMAMGLSFTALTLCAEYRMVSEWVNSADWVALQDVVPTMAVALWILTLLSILLNLTPLFLEWWSKKKGESPS